MSGNSDQKNLTLGPPGTCVLRHRGDSTHRQSVFYLRQACRFSGPFADAIYLSTHSWGSNLPARFWTSPPLLDGKLLRAAPRDNAKNPVHVQGWQLNGPSPEHH